MNRGQRRWWAGWGLGWAAALGLWLAPLATGAAPDPPLSHDAALRPAAFLVDSTGDEADANLSDGVCETAGGQCTLRAAIEQADYDGGGTIAFTGMAGAPTIQVGSGLPALTAPITIDGTTAGGGLVELEGSLAGPGAEGLSLAGDGCTIRGLAINGFSSDGIRVESSDNLIEGNRIGTNAAGTAAAGNGGYGVYVNGSSLAALNNTIRNNLISGNGLDGIAIYGASAWFNVVEGNYIGTDASGNNPLPNGLYGVAIYDSTGNRIGGTTAAQRNVISGNSWGGISIVTSTRGAGWRGQGAGRSIGNVVTGNFVGTNAAGTAAVGNGGPGIEVYANGNEIGGLLAGKAGSGCVPPCNLVSGNSNGIFIQGDGNVAQGNYVGTDVFGTGNLGNTWGGIVVVGMDNAIGGPFVGAGNVAAFNYVGVGIVESLSTGNAILGNATWANEDLGIDLGGDGVTANDAEDGDEGENHLQNYPELDWAATGPPPASTVISGSLDSTASTTFRLELFYSDAADPSGYGEGQHYLAWADVATDSGGWATFVITAAGTIPAGSYVAATVTDPNGNTSEFSAARVVIPETMITIGPGVSGTLIYTDTAALSTTVEVPAGAVSETIILALQPMDEPSHPPPAGLRWGDETFDLSAYLGNDALEGYDFLKPLTITLRYTDTDVYGIDEAGLRLYYWDGSAWQDAANTCSPPSTYFLDTAANVMRVAICHLTEWNIQGPDTFPWRAYLPLGWKD